MPKFGLSYAYDVSYYRDFTIEAATAEEAEKIAQQMLEQDKFEMVMGEANDTTENHRVFLMENGAIVDNDENYVGVPTVEELLDEANS